ncbi:hypothetical protein M378DRAFT_177955 [Amanita muscaria Koide BX008]|uniref:Uncharacterized protein n=1 Tax=Amanita muscaria (strain Koide BX008) TaxID=946122 RepID=A0A0C2WWY5_AMAMK|nr:hypothetical protein M378DRAFT_177955 [Amanita muscaria Koide BX008]
MGRRLRRIGIIGQRCIRLCSQSPKRERWLDLRCQEDQSYNLNVTERHQIEVNALEDMRDLEERWRYDWPCLWISGRCAGEQDRVLVDDYDPKYISHTSKLQNSTAFHRPFNPVPTPEGRYQTVRYQSYTMTASGPPMLPPTLHRLNATKSILSAFNKHS